MPVNSNAPIIPGKEAASIKLGEKASDVLQTAKENFRAEQINIKGIGVGGMCYRSSYVDVWVKNDVIWQIMVHDGYTGTVLGKIGLGSTLADVENLLGPVSAINDNLVVKGMPGICFEPEMNTSDSPIVEIYVWKPDWVELRDHQTL